MNVFKLHVSPIEDEMREDDMAMCDLDPHTCDELGFDSL